MRAAIGIGSNVGDARANVERAIAALAAAGTVAARSGLYRTKAWGETAQPDFINAAVLLETELQPFALLHELKAIEARLGRVPTYRWGPRIIDLDILTYGDERIETEELTIPHARLAERAFALVPLAQIDPAWRPALEALGPQAYEDTVPIADW
jgi:2-amino-4-hydroxy-6-hydroxymethyldihydropteridine diphosphokinase